MFQKPNYVTLQLHWGYFAFSQAAHCSEAHVQSQWERANFDPNDIKIPEIFLIWTSRSWVCPGVLHQCKFSFQSVQWGLLPRLVKYYGFVTFFLGTVFFSGTRPGRTRGWIFTVYGSYDVFSPKEKGHVQSLPSFWGLRQYRNSFRVISPKPPPKGAWIGNFKPNRPNIKIAISCKA